MKRRFFLGTVVLGVLVIAVVGWTVEGIRWTLSGSQARDGLSPALS